MRLSATSLTAVSTLVSSHPALTGLRLSPATGSRPPSGRTGGGSRCWPRQLGEGPRSCNRDRAAFATEKTRQKFYRFTEHIRSFATLRTQFYIQAPENRGMGRASRAVASRTDRERSARDVTVCSAVSCLNPAPGGRLDIRNFKRKWCC